MASRKSSATTPARAEPVRRLASSRRSGSCGPPAGAARSAPRAGPRRPRYRRSRAARRGTLPAPGPREGTLPDRQWAPPRLRVPHRGRARRRRGRARVRARAARPGGTGRAMEPVEVGEGQRAADRAARGRVARERCPHAQDQLGSSGAPAAGAAPVADAHGLWGRARHPVPGTRSGRSPAVIAGWYGGPWARRRPWRRPRRRSMAD